MKVLRAGVIAGMARRPVAANLLMLVLLAGGFLVGRTVKQEVFPDFPTETITIGVAYPGASPAEVERGIVVAVEEAVAGIDGVKQVSSGASESSGTVIVELVSGTDVDKALTDVRTAVARITSLPEDAERPLVTQVSRRSRVISLLIHGHQPDEVLRQFAEQARDALLATGEITQIEMRGVRPRRVAVEVSQQTLRAHGLSLAAVAGRVRAGAVDLPAGGVKTPSGEVLLRTSERRNFAMEFGDITIGAAREGSELQLRDVATLVDGYAETDEAALFNNEPAVILDVLRIGDQTPIEVADAVKEVAARLQEDLPEGVNASTWFDWSDIYRQRIGLLLRNAAVGLVLVMLVLGLFVELRLAFWVTLGIPISFLGSLLLLPGLDVSINMLSLFAFIVTLGMVVDDAIIVGENIHEHRSRGKGLMEAAVDGAREVATPVIFAVLTTIAAFLPIIFVPGITGRIFSVIPVIVLSVLAISLIESLLILPAHLAHETHFPKRGLGRVVAVVLGLLVLPLKPLLAGFDLWRQIMTRALMAFRDGPYERLLRLGLEYRYANVAFGVAMLLLAIAAIGGGHIRRTNMPRVDSDRIRAEVMFPFGSSVKHTRAAVDTLVRAAERVLDAEGGDISKGMFILVGQPIRGSRSGPARTAGSHIGGAQVYLVPSDQRSISAKDFARRWREETGQITGAEHISFGYTIRFGAGSPVDIELRHRDLDTLEEAASALAAAMGELEGVRDIDDGVARGKPQLDLRIRPEAEALGLTAADLARQVRHAFVGAEALRQQRGRDEVRVLVRLPESERRAEHDIESLMIRLPSGGEIPLYEAADVQRGRAYTRIARTNGQRIVRVTADTDEGNVDTALAALEEGALSKLTARYPGLRWRFEGERREREEVETAVLNGFVLALLAIYALLAIPFGSYAQPLIVMSAIPFGLIGALLGHWLLGFNLSNISLMGIVALSGVVVNDSLVLIDAANRYRRAGDSAFEAVRRAGIRRLRPIVLTSLTTFLGLTPMIFEPSVQARFVIPMAVSLGFGVLFATGIILILVPALYLIVDDVLRLFGVETDTPPDDSEEAPPMPSAAAQEA